MARPLATDQLKRYADAKTIRARNENDYRMAAAYCLPRHYNAWNVEGPALYGVASNTTRRIAYDSTGVRALPKYVAILERLATPHNMRWQTLVPSDKYLMKSFRVRQYFQDLTDLLFTYRYNGHANFVQCQSELYTSLGVYGTAPKYIGQRTPNALYQKPSLLYKACPLRDIFILVNDEGEVDTVFRRFWLNVRQFYQKFPNEPMPKVMEARAKVPAGSDNEFFEFVHIVHPRNDFDPQAIDARRHPIVGSYVCVAEQAYVGEEQGYRSLPYKTPRTFTEAGDPYGFSPAMQAMAALGTASAMKKTMIKQGQKAVDPVLLAHDDGVVNGPVDLRPGKVNYGGIDSQGRKLIAALETGNFNVGKDMIADERADIEDCFFATMFKILMETPEMTATQVMDRVAKESALLSPTAGRLQSEDLATSTMREIDVLAEMGKIASGPNMPGLQMPPELIEAEGEYEIVYTTPLAKGMYAEEVSGFMRAVEMAAKAVELTGDQSHMDHFNFGVAIPEMSDKMNVPARWLNDNDTKAKLADGRAQAAQQEQLLKNAGPIAGAVKALAGSEGGTGL